MSTVSVVMATFNGRKYVKEQLNSLISQSRIPDEIIISDDNSTDGTTEIIEEWIRERNDIDFSIKVIKNDGDPGVCGNFENSLLNASGDFIFFCDQDDIWLPEKIEITVDLMKKYSAQVSYCNAQILMEQEDNNFKLVNEYLFNDPERKDKLIELEYTEVAENCYIQGMCLCCKRDFILKLLPFSRGSNHDNWIEVVATINNRHLRISKVLAYYRIHLENTCGIEKYRKNNLSYYLKRARNLNATTLDNITRMKIWWTDLAVIVEQYIISDYRNKRFNEISNFYTKQKPQYIIGPKLKISYHLVHFYMSRVSKNYSSSILFRDLIYIWTQKKNTRVRKTFLGQQHLPYRERL